MNSRGRAGHCAPEEQRLGHECAALIYICELGAKLLAYGLDYLVLVEEVHFLFGWVDIDIDPLRVNLETEVNEGAAILGKEAGICLLDGLPDVGRLDASVIDEEQEGGLFAVVVRIRRPPMRLEAPSIVCRFVLDEFVGDIASVNLPDPVRGRGTGLDCYAGGRLSVLFTRESDMAAVNGIPSDHVHDLVILFRGRAKGAFPGGDIVKQVLHRDLGAGPACNRLRVRSLARLGRNELATAIMGAPCTVGVFRFGGDA